MPRVVVGWIYSGAGEPSTVSEVAKILKELLVRPEKDAAADSASYSTLKR